MQVFDFEMEREELERIHERGEMDTSLKEELYEDSENQDEEEDQEMKFSAG